MVRVVLAVLTALLAQGQIRTAEFWTEAERNIKRLPPSAFAELPKAVVRQAEKLGCTIPQPWASPGNAKLENVIRGEFAAKGQMDWAVLCSRKGKSSIMVFWGGPSRCASTLAEAPDSNHLEMVDQVRAGYSRDIDPVTRSSILQHYKAYGGPKPPPIDHQGIDDGTEKGSVSFYCYRGKWLTLTGAD